MSRAMHRPYRYIYSFFPALRAPLFLTIIPIYTHIIPTAPSGLDTITGTCRTTSGIIKELLNLQKSDKKDIIPWGETYSRYMPNGEVCYVG